MGVNWTRAQLYRTVVSDLSDLRDVYYDVLVFFSPSGIESLFKNFPDFEQKNTRIAAFGNATKKAADDGSPGTFILIGFKYFFPITKIFLLF